GIRDEHVAVRIERNVGGIGEMARIEARLREYLQESSVVGEPLDTPVVVPRGEHIAVRIDGQPLRAIQLPLATAIPAPLCDELALVRELLDPIACVKILRDEDIAHRVNGEAGRASELPVSTAEASPGHDEATVVRELLDTVVVIVGHEDLAGRVDRH